MTAASEAGPPTATPRVAAGALISDQAGRVLLVRPTYKEYWDIPGGFVEPGESPRAACIREITEELGLTPPIAGLLVVDWAPIMDEGDKLLFIFDGGELGDDARAQITFPDGELAEWRFVAGDDLDWYTIARLARRIRTAIDAKNGERGVYAEHGTEPTK
ncbi:NUDIX domain-containing protein [Phytohabitans kaempferiae]|uniref:NUDIX domain-containing protein n=1 Tax=Phytohabitans kaempferiae TaxID=1620943 RepID=A0ABV6LWF3_9ACTN